MDNYKIIYEDFDLLLVDKPQGLSTGFGDNENLCGLVFADFPELKNVTGYNKKEGGLLNRLDNETGGIVFFAKTNDSFSKFKQKMKNGEIEKTYTAVVDGIPDQPEGIIDTPIAHNKKNKKKMIVVKSGINYRSKAQNAVTKYKLIRAFGQKSVLNITITKGVRHQIRVHLSSIGLPVAGDKLYNKMVSTEIKNHLLFANKVEFTNLSNQSIIVEIQVPFI